MPSNTIQSARPASGVASQVLLITGMHRSGTSLVGNLLQIAGIHLGEQLVAANAANPHGYFEDVDFYEFHEQLLHSRGESYLHAKANLEFEPTEAEVERAQALIAVRLNRRLWGWKDPRTSLFLDFWRRQLPGARFLFVYRHSIDVLLSLLRRGEFDYHPCLAAGLKAWHDYNANIISFYDKHPEDCLLVNIEAVVCDPERFVGLLQEKLQLDLSFDREAFDQIFHADELRKTPLPNEVEKILSHLSPELMSLYDRLNSQADMSAELNRNESASPIALSALSQFTAVCEPRTASTDQSILQALVSLLAPDRANEMLRHFNQNAKGLQQKVDLVWLHAQQLERTNDEKDEQLKLQQDQITAQNARLASQDSQLAVQQLQIRDQDHVLRRQARRIGLLTAELGNIHESLLWKLTHSFSRTKERWSKKSTMTTHVSQNGLSAPIQDSIAERLARVREMQAELRQRPVTGSLSGLKRIVYQVIRSTFSRQFSLNVATVDLIETLYRELERQRPQLVEQSQELQNQAQRTLPPVHTNGAPIPVGEIVASCGMTQDQVKLNNIRPLHGFNHVYTSPAEMRMPERVVLYSLVFGLQPRNCLEIGTFRGGSTAIICGAMEDTGFGQLACVDPAPLIDDGLWSQISSRCRMFKGPSPDILPEVARQVGVKFDFALIDGNHTYDFVTRDIAGVLPLMADQSYLLFHDGHYPDVKRAIDDAVTAYPELSDCGLLSVEPTVLEQDGQQVTWAGLRLLKLKRATTH